MQYFKYKIKIIISKYVNFPLNLALACQSWSVITKDPDTKSEWFIVHYGKELTLFYAVKLGSTFINVAVCQTLIGRKVIYLVYNLIELSRGNVSAGPHVMILNERFIPYLQPKVLQPPILEEYPFKDDCRNDRCNLIKFLDSLRQRSLSRYYYHNVNFTVN